VIGQLVVPIPYFMGIVGKVTDIAGNPISDATVIVNKISVKTDKDGNYSVPLVVPGNYEIIVVKEEYLVFRDFVTIGPGQVVSKDIVLEQIKKEEVPKIPIIMFLPFALALLMIVKGKK